MNTLLIEHGNSSYLECLPDGWLLDSEQAALDLVGECAGYETHALLLHAASLPPAFFDLRTRLAGDVLLKFSNYFIRCAALIPQEQIGNGRFYEFVLETNRGNSLFRVFQDRANAERWLMAL